MRLHAAVVTLLVVGCAHVDPPVVEDVAATPQQPATTGGVLRLRGRWQTQNTDDFEWSGEVTYEDKGSFYRQNDTRKSDRI